MCGFLIIQKINLFYAFNKYEWLPNTSHFIAAFFKLPLKLLEFWSLAEGDK